MHDFFQHFDSASSHFYEENQNHFDFNFNSVSDDQDMEYETDDNLHENYYGFDDLFPNFDNDVYETSHNMYKHTSEETCRSEI